MTAQDHDYELGTLDHETLERDESLARKRQQQGDERRWMILGGAGTLALMAALVGAVSLGGSSEPHHLAASLGSPVRDIAPLAAKAIVDQAEPEPEPEATKPSSHARKTQVAHKTSAPAPSAAKADEPRASAAVPAATSPAAAKPAAPPAKAADEDDGKPFAGLPTLPAVSDADEGEPAAPVDFEHDDNPFVDDDEVEDDEDDEDDEAEVDDADAEVDDDSAAPAPAPAPAADNAPAPAAADPAELPTPV